MTVMIIRDVPQSGKLGLTVTFQGRTGLIRRTLVTPSNPKSPSQMAVRSALATIAAKYDQLSDVMQQAWISAASNYQTRPRLGQSGPLTGLQLYTKVNCALAAIGAPSVDTPPATAAIPDTNVTGLEITNAAGTVTLTLTTSAAPPDGSMLWACQWAKSGVRRVVSPRFLGMLDSPGKDGTIDITSAYVTKFGAPPVGTRIFVQVNANVNGFEGPRLTFQARVPAQG